MAYSRGVATTTTISFNNVTYNVASAPIQKNVSRSAVNVTALADTTMQYVAGAVENYDEFSITIYDPGTAIATSTASQTYSITSTLSDGTNTQSVSVSFKAIITKVEGGSIESDGDRKATLTLTFQPTGETISAS